MGKSAVKSIKITMDQYYGITDTKKKNGSLYIYLRYRFGGIKETAPLPPDFYTLNKSNQQKAYKDAKEILDKKLGLSKDDNKNMRKASVLSLIDKYLEDYYENVVRLNINKRKDFDYKQQTVRMQISRHKFAQRTIEELVLSDKHVKEFFNEAREGFVSVLDNKQIKGCAKSTIDKQVWLILGAFRFARFDKKWITADDFELINYQIKKYREVGTYSKVEKTRRLSKYEFALLHKEILERKDTNETYPNLFKKELECRVSDEKLRNYILYLFKIENRRVLNSLDKLSFPDARMVDGINVEKALALYKDISLCVKERMEHGFMTHQPELHYPIIRYYRDKNGHFSTTCTLDEVPEYADTYKICRKTKEYNCAPYYMCEGSLGALFLLFNVNTGFRFNENRCLQVKNICLRKFKVSSSQEISAYYIKLENQLKTIVERDSDGNALYDTDGSLKRVQIMADLKNSTSVREIPLNDTAIRILKIIEDMTGTIIFNNDGTISSVHAERYVFINYNKLKYKSQRYLGREGVYFENFNTKLTYGKLRDMEHIDEGKIRFKFGHVEDKDVSKNFYLEQIFEFKQRIDDGEDFIWDKQIFVIKPPGLLSNSNLNVLLKQILKNMRVPNPEEISIHTLRKTASSIMSEQGESKTDIQHIIGHSEGSEVTEEVYILSHFLPALKAIRSLDKALLEDKENPNG